MVNAITQLFGIGSQWLLRSCKAGKSRIEVAPPKYFEVPGHKVAATRIASIRIDKGYVQFDRTQEPTLQISLNHGTSGTETNKKHELIFVGDQADNALDALADCGYLDDIHFRVKKRVFLNARFDYQDNLSNYQAMNTYSSQSSGVH